METAIVESTIVKKVTARVGKAGSQGRLTVDATEEDWATIVSAVQQQPNAYNERRPYSTFVLSRGEDDEDYNVFIPLSVPPHERNRLQSSADKYVASYKTRDRLKRKHAEKYKTATTS